MLAVICDETLALLICGNSTIAHKTQSLVPYVAIIPDLQHCAPMEGMNCQTQGQEQQASQSVDLALHHSKRGLISLTKELQGMNSIETSQVPQLCKLWSKQFVYHTGVPR